MLLRIEQYFFALEGERLKRIEQGRRVPKSVLYNQEQMLKLLKRNIFASKKLELS